MLIMESAPYLNPGCAFYFAYGIGEYKAVFNDILGISIEPQTIFRSTRLLAHMVKRFKWWGV